MLGKSVQVKLALALSVVLIIWLIVALSGWYKRPAVDQTRRIPAAPGISAIDLLMPQIDTNTTQDIVAKGLFDPDNLRLVPAGEAPIYGLDEQGMPLVWLLLVEETDDLNKAELTLANVRSRGYKAFIQRSGPAEKVLYGVYIGPNLQRSRLQEAMAGLDKQLGIRGELYQHVR